MIPEPHLFGARDMGEDVLLRPPDQRRGKQVREAQIILRLSGEAQCGQHVLHRQRSAEPQAVHPSHRYPAGIELGDDLCSELLALAHQHHDIAGRGMTARALGKHEGFGPADPAMHLIGDPRRQQRVVARHPVAPCVGTVLVFLPIAIGLFRHDRRPQCDKSRTLRTLVLGRRLVEPEGREAERLDHPVDKAQHDVGGAKRVAEVEILPTRRAAVDPPFLNPLPRGIDAGEDTFLRTGKVFRAGALKAEDRLLVIAHGEDRAQLVAACALAAEEIVDQRLDDVPLAAVGVLRLIDQDVIEVAIKLVADPVCRIGGFQQASRLADQIGEIQQALACLSLFPFDRKGTADLERAGDDLSTGYQRAAVFIFAQGFGNIILVSRKIRVDLGGPVHLARLAVGLEDGLAELPDNGNAIGKAQRQPIAQKRRSLLPCLGLPAFKCRQHRHQRIVGKQIGIENLLRPCRIGIGRYPQRLAHAPAHRRLPGGFALPHLVRIGGAHQPSVQARRVLADDESSDAVQHTHIVGALRFLDQICQHLARQQFATPIVHDPGAGSKARFFREVADQELREGVDGVDPQTAARAIEHAGEERPRTRDGCFFDVRAKVTELLGQLHLPQPHPSGKDRIDAIRHLCRARLGKGQAQNLRGAHILAQQQSQYPGRQHLRLAGPCRGRQPDIVFRISRKQLVVLQWEDEAAAAHARASPSLSPAPVMRTSHSSRRISWSYSL